MNIRQKILFSLFAVVLLMLVIIGSVFVFHTTSLTEYKKISDNLVRENVLSQKASALVESLSLVVTAPTSTERKTAYVTLRNELEAIMRVLDREIKDENSQVTYAGLKKIVTGIIDDSERAIAEAERGNMSEAQSLYNDALYKKGFVTEVTTFLLLTEIQHLQDVQASIVEKHNTQLFTVGVWVLFLVLLASSYSIIFARKITLPLKVLSNVSDNVSTGSTDFKIPTKLLQKEDEVGSLARAFSTMLQRLDQKIDQVEKANARALKIKNDLEQRNEELEKFNRMVVNRELKMIELKKEIASLQSRQ